MSSAVIVPFPTLGDPQPSPPGGVCGLVPSITLTYAPEHTTRSGHPATYCTIQDVATGRVLGRLHIVSTPEGSEYRDFLSDELLSVQDANQVLAVAIAMQRKRRESRPTRKRQKPQRGGVRERVNRNWWYSAPPKPVRPARQRLVAKLQARREEAAA